MLNVHGRRITIVKRVSRALLPRVLYSPRQSHFCQANDKQPSPYGYLYGSARTAHHSCSYLRRRARAHPCFPAATKAPSDHGLSS